MGEVFASLVASRPDLFKIVTQPAYALTVISIVPRIPAVLRRLLDAKAKEANQSRVNKDPWLQERNGGTERHDTNGDLDSVMPANGEPMVNGNGVSDSGITRSANGYSTANGISSPLKELGSLKDGVPYTNHLTNGHGEPKSDGNAFYQKSHTIRDSTSKARYNNGNAMPNGIANKITNGHATIDEVPHVKYDPASNLLSPSTHTKSPHSNSVSKADDAIDMWLTEYADMATKEVYDLVNRRGEILLTSTVIGGRFVIRINGANPKTEEKYMRKAFEILVRTAEEVLG